MYLKDSDDSDADYDTDSIFDKESYKQPLIHGSTNQEPVLLSASLFQRNLKLAQICVMLSVVLERAAYYSLLGNMVYYLNAYLGFSSGHSAELVAGFSGLTWISCFIGGVFGDMILGRHKTILTGLILYIVGFCNLPLLTYYTQRYSVDNKSLILAWLLISLIVISLGEGCFKSNMSPFGADQLDKVPDNEIRSYFNYYYWAINIGCLIGFSLLTWIQQRYGFIIGYIVSCCLLLLSLLIFILPKTTNYHIVTPSGNILKKIFSIIVNARKRRMKTDYEAFNPIQHWMDRAKVKYGGSFTDTDVEEVKTLISILPVFGFLIVYCICYYQIPGTFLLQGLHMHLISFTKTDQVPASWFNLFNVVVVLLFVPIIDQYFYPLIERCGTKAPFLFRMSIGMLLATLSMVSAGTLEMYRLENNHTMVNHINNDINITAQDMSIFLQIPQYGLMGISEILVITTSLEFAYCQSPKSMQSFVTSLFFVTNGLGAFLGGGLIALGNTLKLNIIPSKDYDTSSWKDIPALSGNLHYFFYFLAALNFLNLCGFGAFLACGIKRNKKKELERTVAAYIQGVEATMENSLRQF